MIYRFLSVLFISLAAVYGCDQKAADAPKSGAATTSGGDATESERAPKAALEAYYEALRKDDLKAAYSLVSSGDRQAKAFEVYESAAGSAVQRKINASRTFKVDEVKMEPDGTARAFVTIQGPDVPKLQREVMQKHITGETKELPGAEELKTQMLEKLNAEDVPQLTSRQEVFLVKEEGEWAIDFDWDQANPKRRAPDTPTPKPQPVKIPGPTNPAE